MEQRGLRRYRRSLIELSELGQILDEARDWASEHPEPEARASFESWRGWYLYRKAEFREAARCHERASIQPKPGGARRAWLRC